jgi:carboxyl-terminal processing protease
VGERTWGKGSVQNVIEMEGGNSALKLTTAAYMRPSGKNIHRFPDAKESDEWGVMPDKGWELKLGDDEMTDLVRTRRDRDLLLVSHSPGVKRLPTKVEPDDDDVPAKDDEPKPTPSKSVKAPTKPQDQPLRVPPMKSPADPETSKSFVDRQLQKALEYLEQAQGAEQAKAE